jgi:hypothetical protein
MLGNMTKEPVTVVGIQLPTEFEAAYAAYTGAGPTRALARIMVLNMQTYNTTVGGQGLEPLPGAPPPRGSKTYSFGGATSAGATVSLQRLWANGSDAIAGITFDGWSYAYELDGGRPVRLSNVTVGETATVGANGSVSVVVPDSSAVILNFSGVGSGAPPPPVQMSLGRRRRNILGWPV